MKIVVITRFKHFLGGVESITSLLKNIFENEGYKTDIISLEDCDAYTRWKTLTRFKTIVEPYILSNHFQAVKNNYDIVICNGECGFGIRHPKSINIFHGSYYGYRNYLRPFLNIKQFLNLSLSSLIQCKAAKGKCVVAVSRFTAIQLKKQGINVNKVIPNCIDTDFFQPDKSVPKTEKYLFVGSHDYFGKGFDVLGKLASRGVKIDCVTDVRPKDRRLGWIAKVPYNQMNKIYPQYRALIFPSRFEGMALSPLEAMACGLPVVISNVGLGPELKKQHPEFVVTGHDEDAINDYLYKIEELEKNYEKFSAQALEYVLKNHSYSGFKKQWLDLVREI